MNKLTVLFAFIRLGNVCQQLTANMTSADYAANIGRKIRIDRTQKVAWYQPAHYSTTNGGTSHLNVLAPDGTAVSLTSTINLRLVNLSLPLQSTPYDRFGSKTKTHQIRGSFCKSSALRLSVTQPITNVENAKL